MSAVIVLQAANKSYAGSQGRTYLTWFFAAQIEKNCPREGIEAGVGKFVVATIQQNKITITFEHIVIEILKGDGVFALPPTSSAFLKLCFRALENVVQDGTLQPITDLFRPDRKTWRRKTNKIFIQKCF